MRCILENCNKRQGLGCKGLCYMHKTRINRHGSPYIKLSAKGEKNSQWKGGISEYTNHYQMKKIRLKKLKMVRYKCEHCNKKATEIHHFDKTKTNHSFENFIAVCHKCHCSIYHKGKRHPYKGRKEYHPTYLKSLTIS